MEPPHRLITNGVYVVTASSAGRLNGCTVAWVTRVSYKPVLLGVSIYHGNLTCEFVKESKGFVLHLLREDQVGLARHFGLKSGRDVDKLRGLAFRAGATGAPVLEDCLAAIQCAVETELECGDHTLFVGRVLGEESNAEGIPLVYRHSDYEELGATE